MFLSKAARVVALCVDERHELVTQAAKRMSLEAPAGFTDASPPVLRCGDLSLCRSSICHARAKMIQKYTGGLIPL